LNLRPDLLVGEIRQKREAPLGHAHDFSPLGRNAD
jgi:hypothetical protein